MHWSTFDIGYNWGLEVEHMMLKTQPIKLKLQIRYNDSIKSIIPKLRRKALEGSKVSQKKRKKESIQERKKGG